MEPQIKKLPAMKLVGCEESFSPAKGDFAGIKTAWDTLFSLPSGYIKDEIGNDQFWAVTDAITEETLSYIAGGLVTSFDKVQADLSTFETGEQLFAIFEHHGNPNIMGDTIQKAFEWIAQSSYESAGCYNLEMYDSRCNPEDPDSYIVELYFPIK